MANDRPFNPFYPLLVAGGLIFVVTAFAYGMMAFQEVNALRTARGVYASHPLYVWLDAHGNAALIAELIVLGIFTAGLMITDQRSSAGRED